MTQETRTITLPVYRDSDGKPVCNQCIAFRQSSIANYCTFNGEECSKGKGRTFNPHKNYPLWQGEEQ